MKELHFRYAMKISFDSPVCRHRFTVKCIPQSNERQRIDNLVVSVFPNQSLAEDRDSFGNRCIFGHSEMEHERFEIVVEGDARTGLAPVETGEAPHMLGRYRYQTFYTIPGEKINAYFKSFSFSEETGDYEKSIQMMHRLYEDFRYVPGATSIQTTAEEAMELGCGVCQDYSHILISLCHLAGIPARYVVGMLLGEGASHAWVEIYENGKWYALDPTNNLIVDDQHIKISKGRDYKDCLINQGVFTGWAKQTQQIQVIVKEKSDSRKEER